MDIERACRHVMSDSVTFGGLEERRLEPLKGQLFVVRTSLAASRSGHARPRRCACTTPARRPTAKTWNATPVRLRCWRTGCVAEPRTPRADGFAAQALAGSRRLDDRNRPVRSPFVLATRDDLSTPDVGENRRQVESEPGRVPRPRLAHLPHDRVTFSGRHFPAPSVRSACRSPAVRSRPPGTRARCAPASLRSRKMEDPGHTRSASTRRAAPAATLRAALLPDALRREFVLGTVTSA